MKRNTLFSTDFWLNSNGWGKKCLNQNITKLNHETDVYIEKEIKEDAEYKQDIYVERKQIENLDSNENHRLPQISCAHSSKYNHHDVPLVYR